MYPVLKDKLATLLPMSFRSEGNGIIETNVPHQITDWVGNAFCANPNEGFGLSPTTSLRAFQPFFASFSLPYSVIRGEKVPIVVSVFNYLSVCLVVSRPFVIYTA